ncbi:glucosaminidase domain-containing protein [Sporomusa termitida]|uniref:Mannosyl-glycoprotein endo-beta-N-acetylglucosamidase-like domain-containing protein n=1 Tax=Sporomusa termitida TaxID=2377 RepID=A0A517DSB1_9FIRM|nr:glucosaminidase domain-containing protein [Sporomusa termitida]QDR80243.1 hypothetical protein SPTER_15620 [Sporomusa termitida]
MAFNPFEDTSPITTGFNPFNENIDEVGKVDPPQDSLGNAYLNPQGVKSDRLNAYSQAAQSGAIPANPSQPVTKETEGNGALGWFKDAIDSGAAGALAGQAHFMDANFGIGGDTAKYLDKVTERNKREKQYSAKDMIPFASDYWTNPQGAVYDVGNMVGSAGALGVEALGAAGLASMLPGGAVAGGAAAIASRFPTLARFASTPLGKLAVLNMASKPFEAMSEGGSIVPEMRKAGYSEDEIKSATRELAAYNALFLTATGLTESAGMGWLGKGVKNAGQQGLKEGAKTIAKRSAIGAAGGSLQNAFEERTQTALSNDVMGEPTGNWYNPFSWTQEEIDAAAVGGVGGAVLGGAGGALGGATSNRQANSVASGQSQDPYQAMAQSVAAKTGIPAELIYGQLYHESGGFNSQLARENNNFGGLTQVEFNGEDNKQPDGSNYYMKFDNPEKFADYYANYLKKYAEDGILEAKTPEEYAAALKRGGYYTDSVENYTAGIKGGMSKYTGASGQVTARQPDTAIPEPPKVEFTPEETQQAVIWLEDQIPKLQTSDIAKANYIEEELAKRNVSKLLDEYMVPDGEGNQVPLGQRLFPEKFQQQLQVNQQEQLSPDQPAGMENQEQVTDIKQARLAVDGARSALDEINAKQMQSFVPSGKRQQGQNLVNVLNAANAQKFDQAAAAKMPLPARTEPVKSQTPVSGPETMQRLTQLTGQQPAALNVPAASPNQAGIEAVNQLRQQVMPAQETLPTAEVANLKRRLFRAVNSKDYPLAINLAKQLGLDKNAQMYENALAAQQGNGSIKFSSGQGDNRSHATEGHGNEQSTINDFVEKALSHKEYAWLNIKKVEPNTAERIQSLIGVDVSDYMHNITSDDLRHIIKQHGDPAKEHQRGQLPVTDVDLKRIPEIISNYDRILPGEEINNQKAVVYEKRMDDGTVNYVETVLTGRKVLRTKTMWKKPSARIVPDKSDPPPTSSSGGLHPISPERSSTSSINNTIQQNPDLFKSDIRYSAGQFRPFSFKEKELEYGVTYEVDLKEGRKEKLRFIPEKSYTKEEQAISELGNFMGVPVRFFVARRELRGFYDPENGISYINRSGNRGPEWAFWHENMHWMKQQDPALYRDLLAHIQGSDAITSEQIARYRETIAQGDTLTDAEVIEEMLSDEFADTAMRQQLLRNLQSRDVNLFDRLVEWLKATIARIKYFTQAGGNSKLTEQQVVAFENAARRTLLSLKDANGDRLFQDRTEFPYQKLPVESVQFSQRNNKPPAKAEGYRTESGADIQNAKPDEFIVKPDGSIDFGEITQGEAAKMRRQGGKIRLQVGQEQASGRYGLVHVLSKHEKQIRDIGYASPARFIEEVVSGFNEIWQGGGTGLILAKRSSPNHIAVVELKPGVGGNNDYYTVSTALPVTGERYFKNKKPLLVRTEPLTSVSETDSGLRTSPQQVGEEQPIGSSRSDFITSIVPQEQKNVNEDEQSKVDMASDSDLKDIVKPEQTTAAVQHSAGGQGSFAKQLDQWAAGSLHPRAMLTLGKTPDVLIKVGAKQLPIEISQKVVAKIVNTKGTDGGKHGLAMDVLKQLPENLDNPVMVFKSATTENAVVVLTEMVDKNGDNVIAAIHLERQHGRNVVNAMASVYGKENTTNFVQKQIEAGRLLYPNKKISHDWLRSREALIASGAQTSNHDSITSIVQQSEKDVNDGQPKNDIKRKKSTAYIMPDKPSPQYTSTSPERSTKTSSNESVQAPFQRATIAQGGGSKQDSIDSIVAPEQKNVNEGKKENKPSADSADKIRYSAGPKGNHIWSLSKLLKSLGFKTNSNIEILNRAIEGANPIRLLMQSPSRLAELSPNIKAFVYQTIRAHEKIDQFRNKADHTLGKIEKLLTDKEDMADFQGVMLMGDLNQEEYTTQELRHEGYSDKVIRAYKMARKLLDQFYEMANDVHQRTQTVSKRATKAELQEIKDSPFTEIISEKALDKGDTLVTYKERANRLREDVPVNGDALVLMAQNPNIQIVRVQNVTGAILNDYSTLAHGDNQLYVTYREQTPPINKLEGHVRHFFGDWMVYEKTKDADGKEQLVSVASANSRREAIVKVNELDPGKKYLIKPKAIEIPNANQYAAVVGDREFFRIMQKLEDEFQITPGEAQQILDGKVSMKARGRFYGGKMHRTGAQGYETDIFKVMRRQTYEIARFAALDPWKREMVSRYERLYGRWDSWTKHSLEAMYIHKYISDVNGDISILEKVLNRMIAGIPGVSNVLDTYGINRPAVALGSTVMKWTAVAKLGFRIKTALVNLAQAINSAGAMNDWGAMGEGLKRTSGKVSISDRKVLIQSGVGADIGVADVGAGYSQAERFSSGVVKTAMWLFSKTEKRVRAATILGAYHKARKEGMTHGEALEYAKEINQKANGNYAISDTPLFIRAGGPVTQTAFQFKKYPVKQLEMIGEILFGKGNLFNPMTWRPNAGQNARFWLPYLALSGGWGIPGFKALALPVVAGILRAFGYEGDDDELLVKQATFKMADEFFKDISEVNALMKGAVKTGWYGILGAIPKYGVDVSKSTGIGDFGSADNMPRNAWERFFSAFGPGGSTIYNTGVKVAEGDPIGVLNAIAPALGDMAAAITGEKKGKRDRVLNRYEEMHERILKAAGFRTMEEAIASDRGQIEKDVLRAKRDKVAAAIDAYLAAEAAGNQKEKAKAGRELARLRVTGKQLDDERQRKRQTSLERTEQNIPRKYRQEFLGIQQFQ